MLSGLKRCEEIGAFEGDNKSSAVTRRCLEQESKESKQMASNTVEEEYQQAEVEWNWLYDTAPARRKTFQ